MCRSQIWSSLWLQMSWHHGVQIQWLHHETVTLWNIRWRMAVPMALHPCLALEICHTDKLKTKTTRTPAFWGYPPPPHDYPYYWVILDPKSKDDEVKVTNWKNLPKFQISKFWNKRYTWHTFWSCWIRCANMKWIPRVLLKIQSGHDYVHRRADGQGETNVPPLSTSLKRGV